MQINLTLSPLDNLKALILDSNPGLDLSPSKVTFGTPEPGTFPNGKNTVVEATAIKNMGFSGSVDVYYRRLALDDGIGDLPPAIILEWDDSQVSRRDKIIAALGLMGSEVSVLIDGQPFDPDTNPIYIPSDVTIRANTNSLLYAGSDLTMTVELEEVDILVDGGVPWAGQVYLIDEVETL